MIWGDKINCMLSVLGSYLCSSATSGAEKSVCSLPLFLLHGPGSPGSGLWVYQENQSWHGGNQHPGTAQLDPEAANVQRSSSPALPAHRRGCQQHGQSYWAGTQPCTVHQASITVNPLNLDMGLYFHSWNTCAQVNWREIIIDKLFLRLSILRLFFFLSLWQPLSLTSGSKAITKWPDWVWIILTGTAVHTPNWYGWVSEVAARLYRVKSRLNITLSEATATAAAWAHKIGYALLKQMALNNRFAFCLYSLCKWTTHNPLITCNQILGIVRGLYATPGYWTVILSKWNQGKCTRTILSV